MIDRKVWVSTYGLYNDGLLIGRWYDLDTDDVPTEVSAFIVDMGSELNGISADVIGEELHCFDQEGFYSDSEFDPAEALELHDGLTDLEYRFGDSEDAMNAFMSDYSGSWQTDGEYIHGVSVYDDAADYAQQWFDDMYGMQVPSAVSMYLDFEKWGRDLMMSESFYANYRGCLYVFHE